MPNKNIVRMRLLELPLTNQTELAGISTKANDRYGFGLSDKDISYMENELKIFSKQPDSSRPISPFIWPKGKFDENIRKILQWSIDRAWECEGIDLSCLKVKDIFEAEILICNSIFDHDEQKASVKITRIDLINSRVEYAYGDSTISMPLGIEILEFFAYNPQCLNLINGDGIGVLKAPGFKIQCKNDNPEAKKLSFSPSFLVNDKKMNIFGSIQ